MCWFSPLQGLRFKQNVFEHYKLQIVTNRYQMKLIINIVIIFIASIINIVVNLVTSKQNEIINQEIYYE